MGKIIEVPQGREFDCDGCVYNKKETYSKKFGQRYGCTEDNVEPYRSCMARKVKFVDEDMFKQQSAEIKSEKSTVQTCLFDF